MNQLQETEATLFAYELLMPKHMFSLLWKAKAPIEHLSIIFGIDAYTIVARAKALGYEIGD